MDKDLLTRFLRDLDSLERSIQNVQTYCCQNERQAVEITDLFMNEFRAARKDKKIYFFYSCHEIIIESLKKNSNFFVKSFGAKLKEIIQIIAETQDSFDIVKKVLQIIEKWRMEKIYNPEFCEKLKNIIGPYYKELKEQYQKYYGEKDQKGKYTKTFLVNYLIGDPLSAQVYQSVASTTQVIQKLDKLNVTVDAFLKKNLSAAQVINDSLEKEQLEQLVNQATEHRETLLEEISKSQSVYKNLSSSSESEINDYINFSCETYDNWQQKFKDLIG